MMKSRAKTKIKKHQLLYYRHTMLRLWRVSSMADVVLWLSWWFLGLNLSARTRMNDFLWYGAITVLVIAVFSRLARNMGYVQAKPDYLLLATPFLRLKIAYSRIASARPIDFVQIYSPKKMSWADKRFAEPYFKKHVLVLILKGFPLPKKFLQLFFPKFMFHPQEKTAFVLVVPDWMALSTDIDSRQGSWRETQGRRPQNIGMRGLYKEED